MSDAYLSEFDLGDGINRKIRDKLAVSTQASQGLTSTQKKNARNNIDVDLNFVGTMAQWNALSSSDKALYKTVDII